MAEDRKTSISNANSYQAIGEFWDNHDLGDYWDKTRPAEFTVSIRSEKRCSPIDQNLSDEYKTNSPKARY